MTFIPPSDFFVNISLGKVPRYERDFALGRNSSVDVTSLETIWDGSTLYTYLDTAETMDISSTSADDTGAGTGAQTIKIRGLDNNFAKIEEELILSGTTIVTSTNSYLRVYEMSVLTAGSGGENAGDISAVSSTSSILQAKIIISNNETQMGMHTVPAGHRALLTSFLITGITDGKEAEIRVVVRSFGSVFLVKSILGATNTSLDYRMAAPFLVEEKTDIAILGKGITNAIDIMAGFEFIQVQD